MKILYEERRLKMRKWFEEKRLLMKILSEERRLKMRKWFEERRL